MSKAGGRPKDEHWNHVKAEDGKWSCIHCGKLFSGKISVTRIKAHLNKEKGQGIAACSSYRYNEGVRNNMASGSSYLQEPVNIVGSIQEGAPQRIDTIARGTETDPLPEGVTEGRCIRSASESEIRHLNQLHGDLQREESDIKEQLQRMEPRGKKRKPKVDEWMEKSQKLKKRAVDNNLGDVEIKQLIGEMQEHKEEKPVTLFTEFVGRALDENIKKVFKLLEDEQVFVIGIYGMGGVGKTFLVTQVETEVKRKGTDVFWVTVSHNFSISRLQRDIAKRMGIMLEEDDEERIRAANLSEALETREKKSILILDDVWKYIDLQKVGIPRKENNGIKVILTTRLKHVCHKMKCLPNNMIQMLPLRSHEAEELFKVNLGHNGTPATLSPEVQKIATCTVNRFGGLPLGISVMAKAMEGLDDNSWWWIDTWNKLEKLETEVQEEVFKVLKRSYDNLMEKDLQKCFLHCALSPELDIVELIMELVDNGLINGRRSLKEIFVEGKTILDKLEAHSLLEMIDDGMGVCVWRSVADMAFRILKESQRCVMVKFPKEKELTKISHIQEWEDLELVALMPCDISEIPEGMSPCCPRLSTLILVGGLSYQICHIPDCFFRNMNALTVLKLSNNYGLESLPNSLSELRSLVSLVLKQCSSLKYVPPLGELQALARLDISSCSIEEVPEGLEKLVNLKWLDLSENENLTMVGFVDVLPNLTSMQYLDLRGCPHVKIKVEDVQGMNMLECFKTIDFSFFSS